MSSSNLNLIRRKDIDGLRAVAVITVVCGHFFSEQFPSGFLGVDVFFVISGYVITQLIFSINSGKNSLQALIVFYSKRIRRLLPALTTVILVTLILVFTLMTRPGGEITRTGAYALIGVSNMYLWQLSQDYFGVAAGQNPFTHTWSLGVEEQFYFIYPIILIVLTKGYKIVSNKFLIVQCPCRESPKD